MANLDCNICYSEYNEYDMIFIKRCGHYYCRNCIKNYIISKCNSGFITKFLACPNGNCDRYISKDIIINCTSEEFYHGKYLKYLEYKNNKIDYNSYRHCPTCTTINSIRYNHKRITCKKCKTDFCCLCDFPLHDNKITCNKNLKKIKKELPQEYKSYVKVKGDNKRCPYCKIPITRISGCTYMECSNCKKSFCWKCLKIINNEYDHDCNAYVVNNEVPLYMNFPRNINEVPRNRNFPRNSQEVSIVVLLLIIIAILFAIILCTFKFGIIPLYTYRKDVIDMIYNSSKTVLIYFASVSVLLFNCYEHVIYILYNICKNIVNEIIYYKYCLIILCISLIVYTYTILHNYCINTKIMKNKYDKKKNKKRNRRRKYN